MKKLLLSIIMLLFCAVGFSQVSILNVQEVNYYGVDFTQTKVFAPTNPGEQFVEAFVKINSLIISEWSKYKPDKNLQKTINTQDISVTQERNTIIDPNNITTSDTRYTLSADQIAAVVKEYEIAEGDGVGLVIMGELLNKQQSKGSYVVVFFDIATREVIYYKLGTGGAGGFGLRNYWANSLYKILKRWKY